MWTSWGLRAPRRREARTPGTNSVCDVGKLLNLQEPQLSHLSNTCFVKLFEYYVRSCVYTFQPRVIPLSLFTSHKTISLSKKLLIEPMFLHLCSQ